MRKLFTLAAAVLASFSLWAAEPDFESFNWGKDDFATVFADHDGIVISSHASAWKGNLSGIQYIALDGGTDMSAASPTPYFGVTAAAGIDSVEIYWCPNGTDASNLAWIAWDDANNFKQQEVDYKGEGPEYTGSKSIDDAIWQKFDFSATDETAILFGRQLKKVTYEGSQHQFGKNKTVNILGVRVWLHETKTVVSTVETLTAVTINDYPLAPADFTKLATEHTLILEDSAYVTAPVVKFTKHIVITYDDKTTKEKDEVIEKISQQAQASLWGANVDIAGVAYSVYTVKPLSYTVTYLLADETVLGTEVVAAGTSPKTYAQYEVMPLASFNGWYDSDYLETVDLSQVVVNSDTSFYADFDKAYAKSIDFEGMVINNGKSYNVKSALAANFYDYKNIDALDSLNNEKGAARNEPYLGLKIKKQGGYLACNVLPGTTIRIKFGYVAETVLAIAGGDTLPLNPTNNKIADLEFPIMVETLVKLQTTSDKTVVIKQIMVDEPLVTWMYPINYAETENGKVEGWTIAFPNETVTLTATPNEGYKIADVKVNEESLNAVEGVYSFVMPDQAVTVSATFERLPVVEYNITIAEMQNGSVTADKEKATEGELVTLTVSPAEGYKIADVKVNNVSLNAVEGVYSFEMPEEDVTITASFSSTEGFENIDASKQAVKVILNGQLLIKKGDKLFDAQGAVVK